MKHLHFSGELRRVSEAFRPSTTSDYWQYNELILHTDDGKEVSVTNVIVSTEMQSILSSSSSGEFLFVAGSNTKILVAFKNKNTTLHYFNGQDFLKVQKLLRRFCIIPFGGAVFGLISISPGGALLCFLAGALIVGLFAIGPYMGYKRLLQAKELATQLGFDLTEHQEECVTPSGNKRIDF